MQGQRLSYYWEMRGSVLITIEKSITANKKKKITIKKERKKAANIISFIRPKYSVQLCYKSGLRLFLNLHLGLGQIYNMLKSIS